MIRRPPRIFPLLLLLVVVVAGLAVLYLQTDHARRPVPKDAAETPEATFSADTGAAPRVDTRTGLVVAEHYDLVKTHCTACHGGRLVAQNRASREGWLQMIRWMQRTQGLWPLGDDEAAILDYLTTHYAPREGGRRAPLTDIEWYELAEK